MFHTFTPTETPLVLLAEGCFGEHASKTATGVIRYGPWPIAAVIDSTRSGQTVRQVTGIPCDAPVVASLAEAMAYQPKALMIGTAPQGGSLPEPWRAILMEALEQGLHLISGLHTFLKEDPALMAKANAQGLTVWDVRDLAQTYDGPQQLVALRKPRPQGVQVITLVGSDCCVGKMVSALELTRGAEAMGVPARFIATGQTGILITGDGIPLDRMIGDFMAGHTERCVQQAAIDLHQAHPNQPAWIFVEGQGSLIHPGYSGVTLSLLHGSNPEAMILCHNPELDTIWGYDVPMPPLSRLVAIYETAANWIKLPGKEPLARVAGICMNTSAFSEAQAQQLLAQASAETGLPAVDPVRQGTAGVQALLTGIQTVLSSAHKQEVAR